MAIQSQAGAAPAFRGLQAVVGWWHQARASLGVPKIRRRLQALSVCIFPLKWIDLYFSPPVSSDTARPKSVGLVSPWKPSHQTSWWPRHFFKILVPVWAGPCHYLISLGALFFILYQPTCSTPPVYPSTLKLSIFFHVFAHCSTNSFSVTFVFKLIKSPPFPSPLLRPSNLELTYFTLLTHNYILSPHLSDLHTSFCSLTYSDTFFKLFSSPCQIL